MSKYWISIEIISDINTMLCPIKVKRNTIELTVHTFCYCILDLVCVTFVKINSLLLVFPGDVLIHDEVCESCWPHKTQFNSSILHIFICISTDKYCTHLFHWGDAVLGATFEPPTLIFKNICRCPVHLFQNFGECSCVKYFGAHYFENIFIQIGEIFNFAKD